jgi:hypothetical protein
MAMSLWAQTVAAPPMPASQPLSQDQLDPLRWPIALYPADPLMVRTLPAFTFPTENTRAMIRYDMDDA